MVGLLTVLPLIQKYYLDGTQPYLSLSNFQSTILSPLTFESHSGEIQHYVIKFVNDLWQVGGFLRVLRFPPPIETTTTI